MTWKNVSRLLSVVSFSSFALWRENWISAFAFCAMTQAEWRERGLIIALSWRTNLKINGISAISFSSHFIVFIQPPLGPILDAGRAKNTQYLWPISGKVASLRRKQCAWVRVWEMEINFWHDIWFSLKSFANFPDPRRWVRLGSQLTFERNASEHTEPTTYRGIVLSNNKWCFLRTKSKQWLQPSMYENSI